MFYDIVEDYPLIEASFAKQYGIRLRREKDMSWEEFCVLLAGIMPKTPLGRIIAIRSEKDRKVIRKFSKEEKEIYNKWRKRKIYAQGNLSYEQDLKAMEKMFQAMSEERRDRSG